MCDIAMVYVHYLSTFMACTEKFSLLTQEAHYQYSRINNNRIPLVPGLLIKILRLSALHTQAALQTQAALHTQAAVVAAPQTIVYHFFLAYLI